MQASHLPRAIYPLSSRFSFLPRSCRSFCVQESRNCIFPLAEAASRTTLTPLHHSSPPPPPPGPPRHFLSPFRSSVPGFQLLRGTDGQGEGQGGRATTRSKQAATGAQDQGQWGGGRRGRRFCSSFPAARPSSPPSRSSPSMPGSQVPA